jgi:hypothetical protein
VVGWCYYSVVACRLLVVILAVSTISCSSTDEAPTSVDASSDAPVDAALDTAGDGVPEDPSCVGLAYRATLPEGACVTGASCVVRMAGVCAPGAAVKPAHTDYGCACPFGTWECSPQDSSLALILCDGGVSDTSPD